MPRGSGPARFPDEAGLAKRAGALLDEIALQPRFAGSESERTARRICAARLEAQGMSVSEDEFLFSEFPGRYGAPLVASVWLVAALVTRYVYFRSGSGRAAVALLLGLAISGLIGRWLTRGARYVGRPTRSWNLVAARGQPRIWLVAHLDSKSQTLPMFARILAIIVAVAAFGILTLSVALEWVAQVGTPTSGGSSIVPVLSAIAAASTLPVILCLVGNRSPGALDNATGVAAVLLASGLLPARKDLGVILTSAEELGLAGARAYAQSISYFSASSGSRGSADALFAPNEKIEFPGAIALNCDTVDDSGQFICMVRRRWRGAATVALARAAARTGVPVQVRGVIPGVLADSIAFSAAGWDSLTLSRGNIATLARVHTSSDTREQLDGTGIAKAAYLLAATIEELA